MRLPKVNATITHKRRSTVSGNKKKDSTIQTGISAFISDSGTTADSEQTYVIMMNVCDVTSTIDVTKDTLEYNSEDYKLMNVQKKTYHYTCRAIKCV